LVLFLSHHFLYYSVAHFFAFNGRRRLVLALILSLLPVGFIASVILAPRMAGALGKALYFCSALWLGIGLTLMVSFVLAWSAWGLAGLAALRPAPAVLGAAAVGWPSCIRVTAFGTPTILESTISP
jgi:hypothetical protein